jgi:hypothetical protein
MRNGDMKFHQTWVYVDCDNRFYTHGCPGPKIVSAYSY